MSSNSLTIIGTTNRIRAVGTHVDQYGLAIGGSIPCRSTVTPYNVTTADSISGGATVGTSLAPYSALHLTGTGKIWVGDSEFTSGGGGGGGGLESLALANAFDKQGIAYPIPNNNHVRNAFTDDTEMLLYLRKNYSTADTTAMVADHGTASELATVNDMETVGDFTTGTSAPTVAVNTTDKLENTQSVKFTATILNGSADMYETVTLSLTDLHFRVSCYPDTLTNVTEIYVILYTSAGNQRKFSFAAGDLTVTAWNHLTCDLDDDTAYTDTGTFERSNITRIYYGITTDSAQTVVPSFDLSRTISAEPLLIPDYGLSFTMQDNTNQDSFTITAEDRTDNITKGSFTIGATLANNYTNIDSTNYASTTTGTISNNQFTHKSTASGQNAKTAKQHEIITLPSALPSATLESFLRFYDDAFEVDSFPTIGTINLKEIDTAATDKGRFLDTDYVLLFKKLRGGRYNQSPRGSYSANFLRLQLNTDAGDSSDLVTLAHDGSNSVGSDTTGYYVVPESAYLEYSAGAKTASTFTQAVPSEFLVNKLTENKITENFDIADTTSSFGNWIMYRLTNNGAAGIVSNRMHAYKGATDAWYGTLLLKQAVKWNTQDEKIFKVKIQEDATTNQCYRYWAIGLGQNSTAVADDSTPHDGLSTTYGWSTYNTGISVCISSKDDGTGAKILQIGDSSGTLLQRTYTGAPANFQAAYYLKCSISAKTIKVRLWLTTASEPDTWDYSFTKNTNLTSINNDYAYVYCSAGNSSFNTAGYAYMDEVALDIIGDGYTLKYKIEDLTDVDKAETITTLKRGDTTNQNPTCEETATQLY